MGLEYYQARALYSHGLLEWRALLSSKGGHLQANINRTHALADGGHFD